MVDGGGVLQLRDFEPFELDQPTSISGSIDAGDDGTGAITDGAFSTPTVETQLEAMGLDVFISADFVQVTPGNLTGAVDADGEVYLQMAVRVELDVVVGNPPAITAPGCSGEVNLALRSVEDYDPDTGLVTVEDPDFAIPPIQSGPGCPDLLTGPVNDTLAGPGHSLRLALQGDLPLPPAGSEDATATLAVTPAGGVRLGEEVTLAVTVAPVEGSGEAGPPEGLVDLRDGDRLLGTVELVDGHASLTTSALPAGNRRLTARYRGDGLFRPTTSATVTYLVAANPVVTANLPEHIRIGGGPVSFEVTTTNTGLGAALDNARIDLTLQRPPSTGTGAIGPDRITLAIRDGDDWVPVPLVTTGTGADQTLTASIPPATGFPLAPGASHTDRLRLTVGPDGAPAINPGPLRVTIDVVPVDPTTGDPGPAITTTTGTITLTEATRRASAIGFRNAALFGPPVSPPVARQGTNVDLVQLQVTPNLSGLRPTGHLTFRLGGRPVAVKDNRLDSSAPPVLQLPIDPTGSGLNNSVTIQLPPDAPLGAQEITVDYSGDAVFAPSQAAQVLTVAPSSGPSYECRRAFFDVVFRVNLVAQANLPPARPAGAPIDLDGLALRLLAPRSGSGGILGPVTPLQNMWGTGPIHIGESVGGSTDLESITVQYGPGGTGAAAGLSRTGTTMVQPDLAEVDQPVDLLEPTGSVTLEGTPGEVVPVTVDSLTIVTEGGVAGIPYTVICHPVGEPLVLGEVTVAGTTLEVSPGGPVRAGSPVTLSARVAPAAPGSVVEFRDGDHTLGVVPTDADGMATLVTDELAEGARSLTARHLGGLLVPVTTSEPVTLTVAGTDCPTYAVEGNAAVVRLVYLELLGRCPDQAGFDFWTGRLDAGTTPEAFARTIAHTPEAVGVVVDDGYRTILGRAADPAGRAFWVDRMITGSGRYDQLLADLAASPEFWNLAGATNDGFVTRIYDRLLNRTPEPAGLDHWTSRLAAGTPRGTLVRTLANLDEPLRVLVDRSYQQILDRAPFTAERTGDITFLRTTGDRPGLYAQLIGRPEFTNRAQTFPNLES